MKPRILHIYKDCYPPVLGGVEKTIHRLCQGLRREFDPSILIVNDGPDTVHEITDGIPVTKAACRRRLSERSPAPRRISSTSISRCRPPSWVTS
jgi:hypothetical protein